MCSAQVRPAVEDKTRTLARDFQHVVTDTQELLETMGNEGSAKVAEVRKRVQASIDSARTQLSELQASVTESARVAVKTTDQYVRDNPWSAVGIGAGVGVVLGYLIARRPSP
jgi:ElaB/YqjD/DUF883 family membrane-anchored ribosome-binding protein